MKKSLITIILLLYGISTYAQDITDSVSNLLCGKLYKRHILMSVSTNLDSTEWSICQNWICTFNVTKAGERAKDFYKFDTCGSRLLSDTTTSLPKRGNENFHISDKSIVYRKNRTYRIIAANPYPIFEMTSLNTGDVYTFEIAHLDDDLFIMVEYDANNNWYSFYYSIRDDILFKEAYFGASCPDSCCIAYYMTEYFKKKSTLPFRVLDCPFYR